MDYSENLYQQYKFAAQSCHHNQSKYSLHCTVKHTGCDTSLYEYVYHLSNDMKHDFTFTCTAVHHHLEVDRSSTICFASDHCATQYKSKYIFKQWQLLPKEIGMSATVYYDVSGHGNSLVDAMSGFGVKS